MNKPMFLKENVFKPDRVFQIDFVLSYFLCKCSHTGKNGKFE